MPSIPTIEMSLLPADAQLCLSTLHQHLSAFCQIFQAPYASPSAVLQSLVPAFTLPALQRERQLRSSAFPNQTDNLSLRCFSRKSNTYSFSSQTGAFIVTSWWEVVIYSDLALAHILCPAVPFNTAQALECFLSNISSTVCIPIRRVVLRLVARCLACSEREREPS